jgi:hypothetical protein
VHVEKSWEKRQVSAVTVVLLLATGRKIGF